MKSESDNYNMYSSFSEARLNYLQINPYGPAKDKHYQKMQEKRSSLQSMQMRSSIPHTEVRRTCRRLRTAFMTPDQSLYNKDCKGYDCRILKKQRNLPNLQESKETNSEICLQCRPSKHGRSCNSSFSSSSQKSA